MTEVEKIAKESYWNDNNCSGGMSTVQIYACGFLAGLKAAKEKYSKIYMQGRKDERERPCSLCNNPISICKRCDCYPCEGSDTGAYIGACKDFIYKEVKENDS